MSSIPTLRTTLAGCLLLLSFSVHAAEATDLSGVWVSVPAAGNAWDTDALPLTAAARSFLGEFEPARRDSTFFCMPYGTPRNTLNTSPEPIEILQTPNQVTLLFDRLGDTRRIFTDGRDFPEDPIPSWMGYSIGTWQGNVLQVDTIAMTAESILTDTGLPHSEAMTMRERFSLVTRDGETLLKDEITLTDAEHYSTPLQTERWFVRSPHTPFSEGSALCLQNQWRQRLEAINRELYRDLQGESAP